MVHFFPAKGEKIYAGVEKKYYLYIYYDYNNRIIFPKIYKYHVIILEILHN